MRRHPYSSFARAPEKTSLPSVKCVSRSLCLPFAVALAVLLPLPIAAAQGAQRAQVDGTVTEQTGGVIVGATVTLIPRDGADRRGNYRFDRVPAGPYRLTVQATGFFEHRSELELRPGGSLTRDVLLDVGVSISVDVSEPDTLAEQRKSLSSMTLSRKDI